MKLLEICTSPGVGGLELYARKVIKHYFTTGLPCIAVIRHRSKLAEWLETDDIPFIGLRGFSQYFPLLTAWRLARFCEKNGITTIHMHWRGDLPLAAFMKLFCRKRLNLVYTRQMALTKPKFDPYHKFVYGMVDRFLTITKKLETQAIEYLPIKKDNINVLYYGVPAPVNTDEERCELFYKKAGLNAEVFTIAMFGRIEHGKGQHLLLEALKGFKLENLPLQALIVGHVMNDDYAAQLKNQVVETGLESMVRFMDFYPNPSSVMGCFDVVILATFAETFGLVLAEAMRAGTTVIGTNAGGVPEIIQDGKTGLLFEPGNSLQLYKCIQRLYEDQELNAKLALQGKEYADTCFSEEQHFRQLDKYLQVSA